MLKTILLATTLVATLGAGTAFAQSRTITFWNHTFEVPDAQPQQAFTALAPAAPMDAKPVHVAMPHHHDTKR